MLKLLCFALALVAFKQVLSMPDNDKPTFKVDMQKRTFLKDGKPYRFVSGEFHYYRVPHQYWEDRIAKMAAAGLDAIQTYIAWNIHETEEGVYDFEGQKDLFKFFELVQKYNMNVMLRPGPYICGEWDFGGFPAWFLSKNETINLRQLDLSYMAKVERWFATLLPKIKPYLYSEGGPILMVQVENEYGGYNVNDKKYIGYIADLLEFYLGKETVLYTIDFNNLGAITRGSTEKAFATVDFGPGSNVSESFRVMREFNKGLGPLVNSEYYSGWIDTWGGYHHTADSKKLINTIKEMDSFDASYNMYMFFGGSAFGFMNGAIAGNLYQTTSYDYDAPISEAGDITEKYLKIREHISKRKPNLPPVPKNMEKKGYGDIKVNKMGTLLDLLNIASKRSVDTHHPIPMEHINHYYGFILYRHIFKNDYESQELNVPGLRDRGHVLLDGKLIGVLQADKSTSLVMSAEKGQQLDILVENMGRYNYGSAMQNNNSKGIVEEVFMGPEALTQWSMRPIELGNFFNKNIPVKNNKNFIRLKEYTDVPSIYMGSFQISKGETPKDTFLDTCGWTWGVIYVNGVNLGRFRPRLGPQTTLYLPGVYLKPYPEKNVVMVLETDHVENKKPFNYKLVSTDTPQIDNHCNNYN